ncbi:MAG: tetratricopeptide repeat protein [Deltaproteobacteria bacterium]|jgi:pentatricopeptide repeat protein|nr:tetratricopeptide repeat protein [Deltaproteobacteria bacterium]
MQLTVPPAVSQNIARAKSLAKRHELPRALGCLIAALENFVPGSLIGKARYEVEVNIRQCLADINTNPKVHKLLAELAHSSAVAISYTPGEEAALRTVLGVLHKALENMEQMEKQGTQHALKQRKAELIENAQSLLAGGEGVKAKVELRRLTEAFGKEPGILTQAGTMLAQAHMHADAAEFLELAIEAFPKDGPVYGTLVDCYMSLKDYEKAADVYLKAIKNLGSHPRTLVNLAKVYKLSNKRQKAAEAAHRALAMDPGNAEAKAIADSIR